MKKKAFSLIELLISLITISVILASLAPVITHKMKHGGISIGTKKLSMKCPATVGSDCTLCLGNQCIACPISCGNQFKNTLTCKCETCTQANCVNCSSGANQCDRCKSGYQKSGNGCSACGAGYYSNEGGTCQKCPKGSKANANSAATGCTTCDGNKEYQDSEGQTSCKTCSGFVHNNYRSCTSCSAGTYWSASSSTCQSCGAGTYSNSANAISCSSCGAGTYQPSSGQTSCLSCNGSNQYQDTAGQTSCKTCGANSVPNLSHTSCTSTCQSKSSCSSTQYFDGCYCQGCSGGQVPNADKNGCTNPAPTSCPEGQYLANNTCNNCPEGCTKCESATSCTECTNSTGDDPEYLLDEGKCKKYKKPNSQEICNKLTNTTTIYIPDDYTNPTAGGYCMSKRNAGDDINGPKIEHTGVIELHKANGPTYCSDPMSVKCCFYGYSGRSDKTQGTTAKPNTDSARYCSDKPANIDRLSSVNAFDYEGCKRTVCNWWAADYICRNVTMDKKLLWNLPSVTQLESLTSAIEAGPKSKTDTNAKIAIQNWSGSSGLQLCAWGVAANTQGAPRCDHSSRCSLSSCTPSQGWGMGGSMFAVNGLSGYTDKSGYQSVRCVMHKYIEE